LGFFYSRDLPDPNSFSRRQLLTIAANRYYFGDGAMGVQAASQYFFRKNPGELNIAEAALLAGLVKAPSYFSPEKHSDRALGRRNDVMDAMAKEGRIRVAEGESAKASSLQTASDVERVEKLSLHGDRSRTQ
jgi:penicillin-binding protein 1A